MFLKINIRLNSINKQKLLHLISELDLAIVIVVVILRLLHLRGYQWGHIARDVPMAPCSFYLPFSSWDSAMNLVLLDSSMM